MQYHWHNSVVALGILAGAASGGSYDQVNANSGFTGPAAIRVRDATSDGTHAAPQLSNENRPSNVAYAPRIHV